MRNGARNFGLSDRLIVTCWLFRNLSENGGLSWRKRTTFARLDGRKEVSGDVTLGIANPPYLCDRAT